MTPGEPPAPAAQQPPPAGGAAPFGAWQPFTPKGAAAFARATFGRVLLIEFIVALLSAVALLWFLQTAWFPTTRAAIKNLALQGSIHRQELAYPATAPGLLAEGHFLAFLVNVGTDPSGGLASDFRIEFRQGDALVCSLAGCLTLAYPKGWTFQLNRTELEPLWDAWEPILLGIAAVGTVFFLMLAWCALATLYSVPGWLAAYFADRELSWGGSWRLASASLMPGALFLIAGLVLYGLTAIDLLRFAIMLPLHLLPGPVFVLTSLFFLPRATQGVHISANPFASAPPEQPPDDSKEREA